MNIFQFINFSNKDGEEGNRPLRILYLLSFFYLEKTEKGEEIEYDAEVLDFYKISSMCYSIWKNAIQKKKD